MMQYPKQMLMLMTIKPSQRCTVMARIWMKHNLVFKHSMQKSSQRSMTTMQVVLVRLLAVLYTPSKTSTRIAIGLRWETPHQVVF